MSVLFLGFFELLFIIVASQVYRVVYKNMSKLLFNNMLMLIDIGFVMIARLRKSYRTDHSREFGWGGNDFYTDNFDFVVKVKTDKPEYYPWQLLHSC